MKNFWYYVKLGLFHIKIGVMQHLEYPVNLITWMISNPIQWIVGFATIQFVVAEFGTLDGWGYEQLAFLYGLSVLSHGLSVSIFMPSWHMNWYIVQGTFDRMKLRPVNILFQFLFSDFSLVGVTDIIPGILVFGYGCYKVGFEFTAVNAASIVLTVVGAALIRGAVWMILGAIGFWFKNRGHYVNLTMELFNRVSMYPITIYPSVIQGVFTFILPLAFVAYIPASELLGKSPSGSFGIAGTATFIIGAVLFAVSCLLFSVGIKRYDSSGT